MCINIYIYILAGNNFLGKIMYISDFALSIKSI